MFPIKKGTRRVSGELGPPWRCVAQDVETVESEGHRGDLVSRERR